MAERSSQNSKVYLFNCDKLYNLDVVETFLLEVDEKHDLDISTEKLNFGLSSMVEICENTIPQLKMDIAIFVVHAHESRLSINEENAGIGYAKIYRALQDATGDKVLIVIGGDDQYRDEDEEEGTVISRWARKKVASQFNEEYLDGRKSFIFSWNKQHREIHEEALLHYFDPNKKGHKFEYHPKLKPVPKPEPEEHDVTPPDAGGNQQEFVVEDDEEQLVPRDEDEGRRRYSSDRREQTQEMGDQQEGARYGAIIANRDYPVGTVVLETVMRRGEISYQLRDIVQQEGEWQPPGEYEADLMVRHRSCPEATVKFVTKENGTIGLDVKETPWWRRFLNCFLQCLGQQEGARYGTIIANPDYPLGTVLLETVMRKGEISYEPKDVVQREGEWQPPGEYEADLMVRHRSCPEATVKFFGRENGTIGLDVKETPWWRRFLNCFLQCLGRMKSCFMEFIHGVGDRMRVTWAWLRDNCRC